MTTVLAFIAGYFALLVALSLIARPYRVRLATLAHELSEAAPERKDLIKRALESAYLMRAAPIHLMGVIVALLTPAAPFDRDAKEWVKDNRDIIEDPRWGEFFDCHMASVAAVNPFFGMLLYFARWAFKLKAWSFARRHHSSRKALELFGEAKAATA